MNIKKVIECLKNGGLKIAIFYFIWYALCNILSDLLSRSIFIGQGGPVSSSLFLALITCFLFALVAVAGAIGAYNGLLNKEVITLKSYITYGRKYFLGTLGYGIVYFLFVEIIMLVPCAIFYFPATKFIGHDRYFTMFIIISVIAIGVFAVPYIIFNVLGKSTNGYIKKNFKILLLFNVVTVFIGYMPLIGRYISLLFNCIYILLILILHNDYSVENTTITTIK